MARLIVTLPDTSQETTFDLDAPQVTLGRSEDNMIQIDHASVSGHHAQFTFEAGGYVVRDLNSTNGTRVNSEPVTLHRLEGGEKIRFGRVEAVYLSGKEGNDLKSLPEVSKASAEISTRSVKPADFSSASPFKKHAKKKDPLATAATLLAAIAFALLAFAFVSILGIQPPQP